MSTQDSLRIRCYNVRFGDAFLVSVPDRDQDGDPLTRHLLLDVGNVLSGAGGSDAVFQPILEDVVAELDGRPLDLYVMTHEHMDHVQGLLYGANKLGIDIPVDHAWLTASAEGDAYYDRHPEAKRRMNLANRFYRAIEHRFAALPANEQSLHAARLANNNPRSTAQCVEHLRNLAAPDRTHYVYRGFRTRGAHPFRDARFEIWAPEEDTSAYYGTFRPMTFGLMDGDPKSVDLSARPLPPPGVDVGAFTDLVHARDQGSFDNLLQIDKAKNNTSVVMMMEWRGWRFLFGGDAEVRSWREMAKRGALKPVDFLKVSHHGSHNGTPEPSILDKILPMPSPHGHRHAVMSTCAGSYNGVPHGPTEEELKRRCRAVHTTEGLPDGGAFDLHFWG